MVYRVWCEGKKVLFRLIIDSIKGCVCIFKSILFLFVKDMRMCCLFFVYDIKVFVLIIVVYVGKWMCDVRVLFFR